METLFTGIGTALWLGILTSLSPCPMATNLAAVSYIGKRLGRKRSLLASGLLYALGRILAYLALGIIAVGGLLSIPGLSFFLQREMNRILGPVLIVVGFLLLGVIPWRPSGWLSGEKLQGIAEKGGIWGAGLLGIIFALSFCPVSAALFFGSLIPLSVQHGSVLLLPFLYGLGTGLPVTAFALLVAFSARSVGLVFRKLTAFELWARRITGIIFILVGIYYVLIYYFGWDILAGG
jgi:cytochrome c-type biogenesis protein